MTETPSVETQPIQITENINAMTQNPLPAKPTQPEHGQDLAEFFQQDDGKYSTMRAMSFIALIASIVVGAMTMLDNNSEGRYLTTAFLVAAFAPKAVQRFAERQIG